MKCVVACDSFKESMDAELACAIVAKAILDVHPKAIVDECPLADGGEKTSEIFSKYLHATLINTKVNNSLYQLINVKFGLNYQTNTAIIDSASCLGLELIPVKSRDVLIQSSYGLGQLILKAVSMNAKKIICGLGGTGTNDGGLGMLIALGAICYDQNNQPIEVNIQSIHKVAKIDFKQVYKNLKGIELIVACDVENPYVGENGATFSYGKQKGASISQMKILEDSLIYLANLFEQSLNIKVNNIPFSGAAGGLGGALYILNAKLTRGIEVMLEISDFKNRISDADYIFTGEGKIDEQTLFGKTILGVAKEAKIKKIPVIALAGSIDIDYNKLYDIGISSVFSINYNNLPLEESIKNSTSLIYNVTKNIVRIIK